MTPILGWGEQLDVKRIGAGLALEPGKVASYLAKYATKATELAGGVLHPVSRDGVKYLHVSEHVRQFIRAAFDLDDRDPDRDKPKDSVPRPQPCRLAQNAHNFGFRGHCLTKSRHYSVRFKDLREERERHVHEQLLANASTPEAQRRLAELGDDDRVNHFRFAGAGHLTTAEAALAAQAHARAREGRKLAREEAVFRRSRIKQTREEQR